LAAAFIGIVGAGFFTWYGSAALRTEPPGVAQLRAFEPTKKVNQPPPAANADPIEPPAQRVTITGRVVDAAGKPVARAAIHLREQPISWTSGAWHPSETRNIAKAESDAEGRFAFREAALPPTHFLRRDSFPLDVVVTASGHALAWRHLDAFAAEKPLTIVLAAEAQVQGRLIDRAGKSAAKVAVRISEIARLDHEKMAPLHSPDF